MEYNSEIFTKRWEETVSEWRKSIIPNPVTAKSIKNGKEITMRECILEEKRNDSENTVTTASQTFENPNSSNNTKEPILKTSKPASSKEKDKHIKGAKSGKPEKEQGPVPPLVSILVKAYWPGFLVAQFLMLIYTILFYVGPLLLW